MSKLTITHIAEYLPKDVKISKFDIGNIRFRLNIKTKLLPEHAEIIAIEYLKKLQEDKAIEKENRRIYQLVSPMYKFCSKFKIDCYSACCRFLEYKYGAFLETPDRLPYKSLEKDGYWWNAIMNKTGYFKDSAGDICKRMNINHIEYYILMNDIDEFYKWIVINKRNLNKHFKSSYVDYSSMAYNNSSDNY